eukprot:1670417-Rhodomonas_salina.1
MSVINSVHAVLSMLLRPRSLPEYAPKASELAKLKILENPVKLTKSRNPRGLRVKVDLAPKTLANTL